MGRRRIRLPVLPREIRLAAAAFVATAILYTSLIDPPTAGPMPVYLGVGQDKWLHALAYAGFASTLAYAALPERGTLDRRTLAVAVAVAVAYGVGVELVQLPLAARAFDPTDALANGLGAAVGSLPWLQVRGR